MGRWGERDSRRASRRQTASGSRSIHYHSVCRSKATGVADLIVVYPLDQKSKEVCIQEGVRYYDILINSSFADKTSFRQGQWKQIMWKKIDAIADALNRQRFVFYLDTDIVLCKDPFVNVFIKEQKDFWIQADSPDPEKNDLLCEGCIFFYPTSKSKNLVAKWKQEAITNKWPCDQTCLNEIVQNIDVDIGVLDRSYANGTAYWEKRQDKNSKVREMWQSQEPVLIHNNHICGIENKNHRFKDSGLWFL